MLIVYVIGKAPGQQQAISKVLGAVKSYIWIFDHVGVRRWVPLTPCVVQGSQLYILKRSNFKNTSMISRNYILFSDRFDYSEVKSQDKRERGIVPNLRVHMV